MSLDGPRVQCFVPPYILREIARRGSPDQQSWAWRALLVSEQFRGERAGLIPSQPLLQLHDLLQLVRRKRSIRPRPAATERCR